MEKHIKNNHDNELPGGSKGASDHAKLLRALRALRIPESEGPHICDYNEELKHKSEQLRSAAKYYCEYKRNPDGSYSTYLYKFGVLVAIDNHPVPTRASSANDCD
jgi:hypothetical protein